MDSLIAELTLLRKRVATWILLGFWLVLTILFAYVLPYYAYKGDIRFRERGGAALLAIMLPHNLVASLLSGFPFFGGTIILILGVLTMGSEYTWGTLTSAFTQRASRLKVFFSKMLALAIAIVPFVLLVFLLGFIASLLIALAENQPIDLPSAWQVLQALAIAWFIMAVWGSFGVLIAVLSRGTSLAIGLGLIYGLVLEGIISAFTNEITLLDYMSKAFLRTNGYSLVASLATTVTGGGGGPGGLQSSQIVSGTQAVLVLALEIVVFIIVAAALVRRRDVAGSS